jgi:flagellar protein FlaJ
MEKRLKTIAIINGAIVGMILLFNFLFLKEFPTIFSSVFIVAIIMLIAPLALIRYYDISKIKSLEDFFPQFMRDLVESVRSGMTLPQAIHSVSENDYGHLTQHVKKLDAQLNWGIPFDKALMNFSKGTRSKLIRRISSTIIESHRFGGNITTVFEAISSTSIEIERLREERRLYLNSQLITGYVIFFVFLAVIIGLQQFLVPTLADVAVEEVTTAPQTEEAMINEYAGIFRNLIILQGLFAGLVIGKMAEGIIAAGIKHSLILVIIGMIIHTLSTI